MNKKLKDSGSREEIDWLWTKMGSILETEVLTYRQLISSVVSNGCTATILYWSLGGEVMEKKVKE